MPKTNIFRIIITICIIAIIGVGIYFVLPRDTKQIKDFVSQWFTKSESNTRMYNELKENATHIGTNENDEDTSSSAAKDSKKVLKEYYGKYLNDQAIDDFIKYSTISLNLEMNYEDYKASRVEVKKESNGYTFTAYVKITKDSQEKDTMISGKVQMKDKKINWLQLTDIGDF
ncbi:hypothetical protein [Clostridium sp. C105KSO13]|uniref:hypothetical protein n=1 Tax=Clostridium sp. C105KSO13 TaxID=1776045 RepID=UPI00074074A9|nr:hypothetical protein [Clostridium sp. C105KSO13]CUX39337.1 hypothetical protein BN3456_01977 [Clostridium sp. C105KSO13]